MIDHPTKSGYKSSLVYWFATVILKIYTLFTFKVINRILRDHFLSSFLELGKIMNFNDQMVTWNTNRIPMKDKVLTHCSMLRRNSHFMIDFKKFLGLDLVRQTGM
jgi:hypothetical protein